MSSPLRLRSVGSFALLVAALATPSSAQVPAPTLKSVPFITSGLTQPVQLKSLPGDNRMFIVEKTGRIRLYQNGALQTTPFLNLANSVSTDSERGLLGMAFDPDFATNGHVYVNFTGNNSNASAGYTTGTSFVRRYTVSASNPNVLDTSTARDVIIYNQDFSNHNGGWLDFSPVDGMLYIPTGDGGSGNDPNNRAQQFNSELGKLLRIDPRSDQYPSDVRRNYAVPADNPWATDTNAVRAASFAYGLRNPWRSTFDPETGDLYMADVGQGAREEINFQPATSPGGENYGWRAREGKIQTPGVGGARPADNIDPVFDYPRSASSADAIAGASISGGVVYRGEFLEPLVGGHYFFADYVGFTPSTGGTRRIVASMDTEQLRNLPRDASGKLLGSNLSTFNPVVRNWVNQLSVNGIVAFGVDGQGEMYTVSVFGSINKITADRLLADANFDNMVDLADFFILANNLGASDRSLNQGDNNADRLVDLTDLDILIANFGMTPNGFDESIPGIETVRAFAATIPEPATLAALGAASLVALRRRPSGK